MPNIRHFIILSGKSGVFRFRLFPSIFWRFFGLDHFGLVILGDFHVNHESVGLTSPEIIKLPQSIFVMCTAPTVHPPASMVVDDDDSKLDRLDGQQLAAEENALWQLDYLWTG